MLLLAAVPGKAANLVDVRIGVHEKYTRVVLETDAEAPYHIESSADDELVLNLRAESEPRAAASKKSAHVAAVTVKPAAAGASEIRIALRRPVDVRVMVLKQPDRIVLDLREVADEAAPAAEELAPPTPGLEPVAEVPPEPVVKAPPELAEAPPAPKPEPLVELPAETAAAEPVQPVAEEEAAERERAGAAPAIPEPDPSAVLVAEETPPEPALTAPRPSKRPRRIEVPPPPVAESGFLDRLPAPLNQPLVLAGIAAAVILVIAIAVLRRRGTAAEDEPITPFAAGEPFAVDEPTDEQAEVAEESEGAEQRQDADLPLSRGGAGEDSSLFDQPVETAKPPGEEPSTDREGVAVAAPAIATVSGPGPSQELEQRIAQLEERLEEMTDEKDRLGRQVAAQTEELRVQRAAIARTQRVLRDLARPGDEATEPVPKT
jgi:hypothetical protein